MTAPERGNPAGRIVATLPIRSLDDGKRRLARRLSAEQRCRLIRNLCATAVVALRESGVVDMIGLVSDDDRTLDYAGELGLVPIREEEPGLNGALRSAGAWARATGADAHLIVLPDLPLLRPADIQGVAEASPAEHGVVVCPDRRGMGTNVLLLRPCGAIPTMFGPSSFERHMRAPRAAGIAVVVYDSPGTRWDVDTPDDLDALDLDL